jgi:hypothetical protein
MPSQTRAISGNAVTPWCELVGWVFFLPIPNLWALDGVYDVEQPSEFDWSQIIYHANPVSAFSSIGSATVTSISVTLQNGYGQAGLTTMDTAVEIGTGNYGTYSNYATQAPEVAMAVSTTPANRTATWNVSGASAAFIKSNMINTNFSVGLRLSAVATPGLNLYTDTLSLTINYTDPGMSADDSTFRSRGGSRGRLLWGVR